MLTIHYSKKFQTSGDHLIFHIHKDKSNSSQRHLPSLSDDVQKSGKISGEKNCVVCIFSPSAFMTFPPPPPLPFPSLKREDEVFEGQKYESKCNIHLGENLPNDFSHFC
jgi:hypothetical protein